MRANGCQCHHRNNLKRTKNHRNSSQPSQSNKSLQQNQKKRRKLNYQRPVSEASIISFKQKDSARTHITLTLECFFFICRECEYSDYGYSQPTMFQLPEVPPLPVPPPVAAPKAIMPPNPEPAVPTSAGDDNIFADIGGNCSGGKDLDVTAIITSRLNAMRKLQDNPLDSEALKLMYNTQKDVSYLDFCFLD